MTVEYFDSERYRGNFIQLFRMGNKRGDPITITINSIKIVKKENDKPAVWLTKQEAMRYAKRIIDKKLIDGLAETVGMG